MIRIHVSTGSAGAKEYFSQGLAKQDYYRENDKTIGQWDGQAAKMLGISGEVDRKSFFALCDNLHPQTQEQLTPRTIENRRVAYDITFNAPKSVSIAYKLTGDEQILTAFQQSVTDTMKRMEKEASTRVRINRVNEDRKTGNLVWASFVHETARPVNGVPDPNLHIHAYTFNTTYDHEEKRFKAVQFGDIKQNAPFYEACFHADLSNRLQELGYSIRQKGKFFEIDGINDATIDKFSERAKQLEAFAKEKNIKNPKLKAELAGKIRENKREGLSDNDLYKLWLSRLTPAEWDRLDTLKQGAVKHSERSEKQAAKEAINYALEHHFERKSVATPGQIMETALRNSYGSSSANTVIEAFNKHSNLIKRNLNNVDYITTKEAIEEEKRLIRNVRESRGNSAPLHNNYEIKTDYLNDQQRAAIQHVLNSRDQIIIIQGGAGTGKTTLMKEIDMALKERSIEMEATTITAEAAKQVLRGEGFEKAETVAKFINVSKNKSPLLDNYDNSKNNQSVIWVDEAGLVGNKTMNQLIEIAKAQNTKLILTGDINQHKPVERGDALRIMQNICKMEAAKVSKIQRQRNAKDYKQVVQYLSDDKLNEAFTKLNEMGAIKEHASWEERNEKIALEYTEGIKNHTDTLIVAPTHIEGQQIVERIRSKLKDETILGKQNRLYQVQKPMNYTEAQKTNPKLYDEGMSIQFFQNVKGFTAGSKHDVIGVTDKGLIRVKSTDQRINDLNPKLGGFQVFMKDELPISIGEKIRITNNGKSIEGKKLFNGNMYEVVGFTRKGGIKLSNNATIDQDFRNFNYGYTMTSHSSQGKTVDKVIIAESGISFGAASKEQFYVSASRARSDISIYTDDKQELQRAVQRVGERVSATELMNNSKQPRLREQMQRMSRKMMEKGSEIHGKIRGTEK